MLRDLLRQHGPVAPVPRPVGLFRRQDHAESRSCVNWACARRWPTSRGAPASVGLGNGTASAPSGKRRSCSSATRRQHWWRSASGIRWRWALELQALQASGRLPSTLFSAVQQLAGDLAGAPGRALSSLVAGHFTVGGWAMVLIHDDAKGVDIGAYGGRDRQLALFQLIDAGQARRWWGHSVVNFRALSARNEPVSYRYPFSLRPVAALDAGQVQHQLDDPKHQGQGKHHRRQDAQNHKVAGLAVGKVAGAILAALYARA